MLYNKIRKGKIQTMKAMIIYYSKTGNTEKLAKRIQKDFHCEMLKVEPEDPYGNYVSSLVRVNKERKNKVPVQSVTPVPDLSAYDTVFIGYPIWYMNPPEFLSDFISRCSLEGKTVIPFATCGLANVSKTLPAIKRACPKSQVVHPFNYGIAKKDNYDDWVHSLKQIN
jgi:flavodoxin